MSETVSASLPPTFSPSVLPSLPPSSPPSGEPQSPSPPPPGEQPSGQRAGTQEKGEKWRERVQRPKQPAQRGRQGKGSAAAGSGTGFGHERRGSFATGKNLPKGAHNQRWTLFPSSPWCVRRAGRREVGGGDLLRVGGQGESEGGHLVRPALFQPGRESKVNVARWSSACSSSSCLWKLGQPGFAVPLP
jgi:hypothetical protein